MVMVVNFYFYTILLGFSASTPASFATSTLSNSFSILSRLGLSSLDLVDQLSSIALSLESSSAYAYSKSCILTVILLTTSI